MNYQITYEKNRSYSAASSYQRLFDNELFFLCLKSLWILGIFSYLLVLVHYISLFDFGFLLIIFKLFGFIGMVLFAPYVFFRLYFRQLEAKDGLTPSQISFNLYAISDFELIRIFNKIDIANPDINKLFNLTLASKRVNFILSEMNLDPQKIAVILNSISKLPPPVLLNKVLSSAIDNALKEKERRITTADIFYGFILLVDDLEGFAALSELEVLDIQNIVFWANSAFNKIKYPKTLVDKLKRSTTGIGEDWVYGYTPYLDSYGFTIYGPKFADSSYAVGRKQIIEQMETILARDSLNNCLLVGETGSGKKTIVYALAAKMFSQEAAHNLKHHRVVQLNVEALLSGASGPQEIEERLLLVLEDAAHAGNVILFIENIHVLFEASAKVGAIDATEVLSPYLQSKNIRVIGTTNNYDYESHLAPKKALAGLFERINVLPTNKHQTIKVLEGLTMYYWQKYQIKITYTALKEVYRISDQFLQDTEFPRKAIDLLENILSHAKKQGIEVLDNHSVGKLGQNILGIPIASISSGEKDSLLNLEKKMHERLISQNEAVSAVVNALKRKRAQVHDSLRPIGVFLFLGPTGVGKTEVAKTLAASYFGDENAIIRLDMNQFQDSSSTKHLFGEKQPGLDELEGGQLVKEVRRKPFSVLLLDELEKAHKDVLNLFLQIFDEGYAKDGMGNVVKFANTIIIATSNAEANLIREGVTRGTSWSELKEEVLNSLQQNGTFAPEFLNRFDEIVMFKPLFRKIISQRGYH